MGSLSMPMITSYCSLHLQFSMDLTPTGLLIPTTSCDAAEPEQRAWQHATPTNQGLGGGGASMSVTSGRRAK